MSLVLSGSLIRHYYALIDANDLDDVLALFADGAVYHRAGITYRGKSEIVEFFVDKRKIRGEHVLEQIYSLGREVVAIGRFEGVGAAGDSRSVGFADFWTFNEERLVSHRRTFLAIGHQIVQD